MRTARVEIGQGPALAVLLLVGAALSWLSASHPAAMPAWAPWEFSWLEYLGSALALYWYGRGIARLAPAVRPPAWRQGCYGLGVIAIYAVVQTRFTYLAQHLFAATQVQQLVLHDFGPFLVALAWPGEVLKEGMPSQVLRLLQTRRLRLLTAILQQPVIAAALFILLLVAQAVPSVLFAVMLDWRLFDAMNIMMAADGVLFWCLVLDPRPKPPARLSFFARMVLAFVVMMPVMPLGAYIAFTSHALYNYYEICGRLWLDALRDQRMGGLILWIPGGFMSVAAIIITLNAMRLADERMAAEAPPQPGRRPIDAGAWTGRN